MLTTTGALFRPFLAIFLAVVLFHEPLVSHAQQTIHVGLLTSTSGSVWVTPESSAAVDMAIADIAALGSLLPGYSLQLVRKDTQCTAGPGVKGFFELLTDTSRPVVGFVGPACSSVAKPVTQAAQLFHLISVSMGAGSMDLIDKARYPRFMRTYPNFGQVVAAPLSLAKHFGWRRMGVLTEKDASGISGIIEKTATMAAAAGIEVTTKTIIDPGLPEVVAQALYIVF